MLMRFIGLAAVIAIASVGVAGFAGRGVHEAPRTEPSAESNWTTQQRDGGGRSSATVSSGGEIRLDRSGDSHFYAEADIDGTRIRMMVDSGASVIALTRRDAEAIGIDVDGLPVAGIARTAGGEVPVRRVVLDSVDIGGIGVRGVEAAVIETDMGVSLLGQSYLAKLDAVNIEGDTMTLR